MILLQDSPLAQSDKEMLGMILFKCKRHYNIMDIRTPCRKGNHVECKRMAAWFITQYTDCNVYHIAKILNIGRPTVLHHLNKVVTLIQTNDSKTIKAIDTIGKELCELV